MCDILLQMHFKNPTQTPKMAQLVSVPTRSTASSSRSTCWSSSAPSSSCCSSTTRRSRSGPGERRPRRGRTTQPQPRSSTAISRVGPKKKNFKDFRKLVTPLKYTSCLKQATFVGRTVAVQVTRQPSLHFNRLSASYSRFFLLFAK